MSEVTRIKCDGCDYVKGEQSYSYKTRNWFSFYAPLVDEDENDPAVIWSASQKLDFCSPDCLGHYLVRLRVERRDNGKEKGDERELQAPTVA